MFLVVLVFFPGRAIVILLQAQVDRATVGDQSLDVQGWRLHGLSALALPGSRGPMGCPPWSSLLPSRAVLEVCSEAQTL